MEEERDRLSAQEAARALGISEGAVRKRLARGTLRSERDAEGRVWVLLEASTRSGTRGQDAGQTGGQEAQDRYTRSLEEQVAYLRDQLSREQEAHSEARRIVAGLVSRVPELEAAQDASQTVQEDAQEPERPPGGHPEGRDRPDAQEGARRPWWRRVFGE
jgi:predicted ArsR family transcriptional regulator